MSAVHDGICSPWVMCSCRVVRGDQIRDSLSVSKSWHNFHFRAQALEKMI